MRSLLSCLHVGFVLSNSGRLFFDNLFYNSLGLLQHQGFSGKEQVMFSFAIFMKK